MRRRDPQRDPRTPVCGQQDRRGTIQCHLDHRPEQFAAQTLPADAYQGAQHENGQQGRADLAQTPGLAVEMEYDRRAGGAEQSAEQAARYTAQQCAQAPGGLRVRMWPQHEQDTCGQDDDAQQSTQEAGQVGVQSGQQGQAQTHGRQQSEAGP